MRIDNYGKVFGIYKSSKPEKNKRTTRKNNESDTVEISGMARTLQVARTAVSSVPDVREDRVAALRKSINEGTYAVSSADIADKLLSSL